MTLYITIMLAIIKCMSSKVMDYKKLHKLDELEIENFQ